MKTKLFFFFLVCLCATLLNSCNEDPVINPEDVTASGTCGDGLTWTIVKDTALLITGKGEMADYVYCHDVNFRTEDQAPWAFHRKTITLVSIGGKVSRIGSAAFSGCSSLTSITIPNSVTSIGSGAFYGCSRLTSISIPNSVTIIGNEAFYGCSGLMSITIPNSVTSIGDWAFRDCSGLKSITIPNSVTSIGYWAFYGCSGLMSITIPNSVTSIGEYAFKSCSGLTSIIVESGNTVYDSRNNCNAIIEKSTNSLILGCKNTIIPNGVTSIGEYAFCDCSGLTSIVMPEGLISIGTEAFRNCSDLTSVTIPNTVTSVGERVFIGCSKLPIENDLMYADSYLVRWAEEHTTYAIKPGTKFIGSDAFGSCRKLTTIVIPNSVIDIGVWAFCCSSELTSVKIGNNVTKIGWKAFEGCSGLTSVIIPQNVANIEYEAFSGCSGLTSITCEASQPPVLGDYEFTSSDRISQYHDPKSVFGKVDKTIPLYVPSSSVNLYRAAEGWKEFTNIIGK